MVEVHCSDAFGQDAARALDWPRCDSGIGSAEMCGSSIGLAEVRCLDTGFGRDVTQALDWLIYMARALDWPRCITRTLDLVEMRLGH